MTRIRATGTRTRMLVAALAVGLLAPMTPGVAAPAPDEALTIRTLSNRADLISGGDALVAVDLPRGVRAGAVVVRVGARDVTDTFADGGDGRLVGLVDRLRVGRNVVTATLPDGRGAMLVVTNHPRSGPVFSGPHLQPWTCAEDAKDATCRRPTTYAFLYRSTNPARPGLVAYDPEQPPDDVATTTTDTGETVPFVVRVETGVIARDEYKIAVLFDPSEPWSPVAPQKGWNRKLLVTHGSSCDTSYEQGTAPSVVGDTVVGDSPTVALGRGFAVMSHALNHNGHNCNVVTQGEAMMMTKEHLADTYGEIRYTIGTGCSGGAVAQYQVANAFPGFYQGILPACSFPDSWSSRMLYEDYSLLRAYFEDPTRWTPGVAWGPAEIEAVWGHPNPVNARVYNTAIAPVLDPSRSCPGVADEDVYDPEANPEGVRCSLQDYMVNILGRRPRDGFANKPFDNTGVQYGLRGLLAGKLTPEQFVDVNAKVGGRDIDYEAQAERSVADRPALDAIYRSGAFNQANNLDRVAIIDLRGQDPGAFHDVYRSYAVRARLDREHGDHDNHVLWRGTVPLLGDTTFTSDALVAMDEWLAAVDEDRSATPLADKIVRNRPATLTDRCTDGTRGADLPEEYCNAVVDSYSTARIEAGMPFTDDIAKCRLNPLRRSDYYPVRFTEGQWARLRQTFPSGVCDYTRPGVGQQDTIAWATYADGPGGRPLGPAPVSATVRPTAGPR